MGEPTLNNFMRRETGRES
jgi:hypothetical protein